jgi:hypothetical protein
MGLATVTKTEWGYYVTGDTDPTPVWTDGRKYIKTIVFVPGAADDTGELDTLRNIDGPSTPFSYYTSGGTAGIGQCYWHLDDGIPADNLMCTFSNSGGAFYIYLR